MIPPRQDSRQDSKAKVTGTEQKLSDKDIRVVLKWLSRDLGVVVTDGQVVKILDEQGVGEITEADRGTLTILTTIGNVERQVESLSAQISKWVYQTYKSLIADVP